MVQCDIIYILSGFILHDRQFTVQSYLRYVKHYKTKITGSCHGPPPLQHPPGGGGGDLTAVKDSMGFFKAPLSTLLLIKLEEPELRISR